MVNSPGAERDQDTDELARRILLHCRDHNVPIDEAIEEILAKLLELKKQGN